MILKLENDKPLQISLKYKSALEKPGRYGIQFLYTLHNGDALFVPPVAHQEIQSLHVEAGEPFIILKSDATGKVVYSVERVPAPGPKLVAKKAELLNQLGDVLMNGVPEKPANSVNTFYLDRATRLIDVFAEANRYAAGVIQPEERIERMPMGRATE